jgi:ribulose 1,5-bisphosphate carboxylase large subunit-like protein
MGVDTIHTGMWGGYLSDDEVELDRSIRLLNDSNVVPALSCGMHPGLVEAITRRFGTEYMANVGGAVHGHPEGTIGGARAMRQAIDRDYKSEYIKAIEKWGLVND